MTTATRQTDTWKRQTRGANGRFGSFTTEVVPATIESSAAATAPDQKPEEVMAEEKTTQKASRATNGFGPFKLGNRLWARHKGVIYWAELVTTDEGPMVRVEGVVLSNRTGGAAGKEHVLFDAKKGSTVLVNGLSKAAGHFTGYQPSITSFWHTGTPVDKRTRKAKTVEAQAAAPAQTPVEPVADAPATVDPTPAQVTQLFEPSEDQSLATPGNKIWFCFACSDVFMFPDGMIPTVCYNGHKAEDLATPLDVNDLDLTPELAAK